MADDSDTAMVAGLLTVPLVIGLMLYRCWAIALMWGWFMVPLFGLPALSVPAVVGVAGVVNLIKPSTPNAGKFQGWRWMLEQVLNPLIALAIGAVARRFM